MRRLNDFRAAAMQTAIGYISAGLGFLCEVVVAIRYGASVETDSYRWATLLPFYVISIIGSVLIPAFFRSRIAGFSRLALVNADDDLIASRWTYLMFGAIAITLLALLGLATFKAAPILVLGSVAAALGLVMYSLVATPWFYAGHTWIYSSSSAILNVLMLFCFAFTPGDLITKASTALFGVGLATSTASYWLLSRVGSLRDELSSVIARSLPPENNTLKSVLAVSAASMLSVLIIFKSLAMAGPGLLSIYSLTQKMGLLISVPSNALANRYIRHDFITGGEKAVPSVKNLVIAVLPIVLASPVFAVMSYFILAILYGLDPGAQAGLMVASACAVGAIFTGFSLCYGIVIFSPSVSHLMVWSSIATPVLALIAGAFVLCGPSLEGAIVAPLLGNAGATAIGLAWLCHKTQQSFRPVGALFVLCALLSYSCYHFLKLPLVDDFVALLQDAVPTSGYLIIDTEPKI